MFEVNLYKVDVWKVDTGELIRNYIHIYRSGIKTSLRIRSMYYSGVVLYGCVLGTCDITHWCTCLLASH